MSAVVRSDGTVRQLDGRAEPDENITEEDAKDASRLARLLIRILRDLAAIRRRWWPRRIYFPNVTFDDTGTTKYRFPHGFGAPAEWTTSRTRFGGAGPFLDEHADTTNDTLVLTSLGIGTCTIVLEEPG